MANVRDLKKDINFVFGDIIDVADDWEQKNPDKDTKASENIINEAFDAFDDLMAKVNDRSAENKKAHFKAIKNELEDRGRALIEKLNKLG